jgi:tetratricopeptide (TPR) repeat protein
MYDLNRIFSDTLNFRNKIYEPEFTIPADSFIYSIEYQNFIKYKKYTDILKQKRNLDKIEPLDQHFIKEYKNLNPQYYYTYFELGEYYAALKQNEIALEYYKIALKFEVPRLTEIQLIEGRIDAANQN